jgi:hypothetical protein
MKKFYGGISLVAFIIMLSALQVSVVSCTKESTDTITVIQKDTTVNLQIITANPWKIQEIRGLRGTNKTLYYLRGATGNTDNFDNEYIVFNTDKTGMYTDNNGGKSNLTWDFATSDSSRIAYTVSFPGNPITITWSNLSFKDGRLKYEEYYTNAGINVHTYGIRIPR